MRDFKKFLQERYFIICSTAIVFFAIAIRFYNYTNRITLAADQAGFAIIARFSLLNFQLPFLGPFSSAGPFQTGGEWYWIVMAGSVFNLGNVMSPWYFMTLLSVLFVVLMIFFGRYLSGNIFGLFLGLLTAVSTSQIIQSPNLTNQTPIMLFTLLGLWSGVAYARTTDNKYIFLQALSIGIASTIHLQGAAAVVLIASTLLFTKTKNFRAYLLVALGIAIAWIPVLIVDVFNNFFNTRNMLQYYLFNTSPVPFEVLGRRWLTFILYFVPSSWGYIVGGNIWVAYGVMILATVCAGVRIVKRTLTAEWYILFVTTGLMIAVLRYTRTPLFDSYLIFLHPFVLTITCFGIYAVFRFSKIMGVLVLGIVIISGLHRAYVEIPKNTNTLLRDMSEIKHSLIQRYPNTRFTLFDYDHKTVAKSYPVALLLYQDHRITENGHPIGFTFEIPEIGANNWEYVYRGFTGIRVIDLEGSTSAQLTQDKWELVSPKSMYDATEYWYKK